MQLKQLGVAFDLYFEDKVRSLFNALERVVDAIRNNSNNSMLNCIIWYELARITCFLLICSQELGERR